MKSSLLILLAAAAFAWSAVQMWQLNRLVVRNAEKTAEA